MAGDLPADLSQTIDSIEAYRAQNNTLWMNIIRLVYRHAPEEAAAIFRSIEKNDEHILALSKRSAEQCPKK